MDLTARQAKTKLPILYIFGSGRLELINFNDKHGFLQPESLQPASLPQDIWQGP